MFKIVLLTLALTGLQALPISRRLTKTLYNVPVEVQDGLSLPLNDEFRQGTEPSRRFIVDLHTGLVQDYISEMNRRTGLLSPSLGNGHGEMSRKHWLRDNTAEEVLVQRNGGGWVRVEEHAKLPDRFRQGTEPSRAIPEGFRQGTEPAMPIPDGYRQGTERVMPIPDGFRQGTEPSTHLRDGFRQGTERFMPLPADFRQGTEPSQGIQKGFRQGTEPTNPENYRDGAFSFKAKESSMPIPDGFRQGTEPSLSIPNGFRQGTEPTNPENYRKVADSFNAKVINAIPSGFRQGTEPSNLIPVGFRQGTERSMPIPEGFRQGTEPSLSIPDGFRQGTEPKNPADYRLIANSFEDSPHVASNQIIEGFRPGAGPFMPVRDGSGQEGIETFMPIPGGFRQGTEPTDPVWYKEAAQDSPAVPSNEILEGFRPGTGPFMPVRDGTRQDIQASNHIHAFETSRQRTNIAARCNGEVINGRCYAFNPTPMPFLEAQDSCKSLNPKAELAAVTNEDLHSRLVSMVTKGGQRDPVMTWLGGTVKHQRGSWLDGSEWRYSDWMPGQPNVHTDKPVCVEMFRMDETWWTTADCDLKRASICSYPVV